MKFQKMVFWLYDNFFSLPIAILSIFVYGSLALGLNWSHGLEEALRAGATGGLAGFFSTGITARIIQHFSLIESPLKSYSLGSVTPAFITFLMNLAHFVNGTPEMFLSCSLPILISFGSSFVTNFGTRHFGAGDGFWGWFFRPPKRGLKREKFY